MVVDHFDAAEVPPVERQVLFIAKHPEARLIPLANVDEAAPVTSSFMIEVEAVEESREKIDDVVVANVVTDDVAKYNILLIARRLYGALVSDASVKVSWGRVDVERVKSDRGVVVPKPADPFFRSVRYTLEVRSVEDAILNDLSVDRYP